MNRLRIPLVVLRYCLYYKNILLLFIIAFSANVIAQDCWSSFRGNQSLTGYANVTLLKSYKLLCTYKTEDKIKSSPIFCNDNIYVGSNDGNEIGGGTCIFVENHLICLDVKGNLYLVMPNPKSFNKVGEIKEAIKDVKNLAWTSPVAANGKLYLRYMQTLICFNLLN